MMLIFGLSSVIFIQRLQRSKITIAFLVGVEPVGTDAGLAATFETPFPVHNNIHGANKYGLASLTNLDKLPSRGSVLIASPLKLKTEAGVLLE